MRVPDGPSGDLLLHPKPAVPDGKKPNSIWEGRMPEVRQGYEQRFEIQIGVHAGQDAEGVHATCARRLNQRLCMRPVLGLRVRA